MIGRLDNCRVHLHPRWKIKILVIGQCLFIHFINTTNGVLTNLESICMSYFIVLYVFQTVVLHFNQLLVWKQHRVILKFAIGFTQIKHLFCQTFGGSWVHDFTLYPVLTDGEGAIQVRVHWPLPPSLSPPSLSLPLSFCLSFGPMFGFAFIIVITRA